MTAFQYLGTNSGHSGHFYFWPIEAEMSGNTSIELAIIASTTDGVNHSIGKI
jgi:hypothetical protein